MFPWDPVSLRRSQGLARAESIRWLTSKYSGWRTPRYIISPWTRGGNVFTERADHSSDIMFVERWAAENGYEGVYSKELTEWRREFMSDLTKAFDFDHVCRATPPLPGNK